MWLFLLPVGCATDTGIPIPPPALRGTWQHHLWECCHCWQCCTWDSKEGRKANIPNGECFPVLAWHCPDHVNEVTLLSLWILVSSSYWSRFWAHLTGRTDSRWCPPSCGHFCCQTLNCKVKVKSLSHVWLFATLWTVALQAPLSMGSSRKGYCSGLPFPSPVDLPKPGIEPGSPALQAGASKGVGIY